MTDLVTGSGIIRKLMTREQTKNNSQRTVVFLQKHLRVVGERSTNGKTFCYHERILPAFMQPVI